MASQGLSRKRPAPGSSPVLYHNPYPPPSALAGSGGLDPRVSDEQFLKYGYQPALDHTHTSQNEDSTTQESNPSSEEHRDLYQLARRSASQVVSRDPGHRDSSTLRLEGQTRSNAQKGDGLWGIDLDSLKRRAQVAKRDAQSKRKQIPPFVQKLASFLDDGKNTNLIRWSDDGNSFIVEDEDEFAKTLIPELFKHNNYASFVRQLNMYGFHKKVGLSDNSMRASEKKSKSPSEYSNPCFRRGHPDLLWLIQKSKNTQGTRSKGSKRTDQDWNEDDIDDYVDDTHLPPNDPGEIPPRFQLAIGQGNAALPSDQLKSVHLELQNIRQQQSQITAMIQRLKREHERLYGQAATFQDQHSRHENSINAILTFLATIYNRGLHGHEGMQGIANLFTGAIPQDSSQNHVLDVGDYPLDQLNTSDGPVQRQYKKQPLLLKAAPADGDRVSTSSPRPNGSPYEGRQTRRVPPTGRSGPGRPGNVEEVLEMPNRQQRPQISNQAQQKPQNDILSVILNSNARNSTPESPAADFSSVLNSLESSGGGSALTNTQRADMLRLISDQGSSSNAGGNALTSPNPPPVPNSYDDRLAATGSELEDLAKLQADQDRSVQNLTQLLQPLSPNGSIPGIGDGSDVQPPPLDIDEFLNSTSNYFTEFPSEPNYTPHDPESNTTNTTNNNDKDKSSDDSHHPNTQYTGINLADFDPGDDELFPDVGSTSNAATGNNNNVGTATGTHTLPHYDHTGYGGGGGGGGYGYGYGNLGLDGVADDDDNDDDDHDDQWAGRVESVPISEVTTPTTASAATADIEPEPFTSPPPPPPLSPSSHTKTNNHNGNGNKNKQNKKSTTLGQSGDDNLAFSPRKRKRVS